MNIIAGVVLDWPNLVLGAVIGLPFGYAVAYFAHKRYDQNLMAARAKSLHQKYGKLAGTYANYRPDGSATGGSVELKQRTDGAFDFLVSTAIEPLTGKASCGRMKNLRLTEQHTIVISLGTAMACNLFGTSQRLENCTSRE